MSPFHLKRENANHIRMVYSDHNPVTIETNLLIKQIDTEESKRRRVLTEEGRMRYRMELEEREVSKIWDRVEDLQETYTKWQKEVEEIKCKHEQVRKMTKKRNTKTMRLLLKEKKELKGNMRKEGNNTSKMEKLQTLKKRILDEEAESYYRRLQKTCNDITKDGKFNSGKFWEVKKGDCSVTCVTFGE